MRNDENQQSNLTGIILAAGRGTRFGADLPAGSKAMLSVAGHPLLAYALGFLRELGISNRIVVSNGHPLIESTVHEIDPDARVIDVEYRPGNLHSFLAAFEQTTGSVLVMNVDHLYDLAIVPRIQMGGERIAVYADFQKHVDLDERGILTDADGRIKNISKQLPDANAVCVGLTYIPASARETYMRAIPATVERRDEQTGYEDVLQTLAQTGEHLIAADVSGINPYEIDVPEEWKAADVGVASNVERFLRS